MWRRSMFAKCQIRIERKGALCISHRHVGTSWRGTCLVVQLRDELLVARQHVRTILGEAAEGPVCSGGLQSSCVPDDEQVLVVRTALHLSGDVVLTLSPVYPNNISNTSASSSSALRVEAFLLLHVHWVVLRLVVMVSDGQVRRKGVSR